MENNDSNHEDGHDPQLEIEDLPEVGGPNNTVLIEAREQDLGGFTVRRVLPFARAGITRRHVGSFVFLDHIGPAELDQPMFVSEHPHIGLATATYLFEGEIHHKDSIGSDQVIREGELNLMTAGEWITHLEQGLTHEIHGLQFWIALPLEDEECAPTFRHYSAQETPSWQIAKGVTAQLLMGEYADKKSSVECRARMLFMVLDSSTSHRIPLTLEMNERELGLYVCEGHVTMDDHGSLKAGQLLVFDQPADGSLNRLQVELGPGARVVLFGGDALDRPRLMKWNYVASDQELIDQAEAKWAKANKNSIVKPQPPF
jgi:redox-sensitive bicupin YhaK (pirin superfamily)